MKELLIKEKAERYDKLLVKLYEAKVDNNVCDEMYCCVIDDIFPELKESEDERIRKEILTAFSCGHDNSDIYGHGITYGQVRAWLERQGEKKSTLPKWKYKKDNTPLLRDSIILNKYGCVAKSPSGAIVSDVWVIDYSELTKLPKEEFEKQGEHRQNTNYPKFDLDDVLALQCCMETVKKVQEDNYLYKQLEGLHGKIYDAYYFEKYGEKAQGESALEAINEEKVDNANKVEPKDYNDIDPHFGKPADKIEPKFHEGDWVVSKLDGNARQISEVHCDEYNDYYIVEGDEYQIEEYDRLHHLWTIQDAKAGDVLATKDAVFILKHIYKTGLRLCKSYCEVIGDSKLGFGFDFSINGVYPATKEQREQLAKAIADAGYVWFSGKKELKKIKPSELGEDRSKELSLSIRIQAYLNTASDELYAKGKPLYSEKRIKDIHKCMLMWQKLHNAYFYQSPAWSEEDELALKQAIYVCHQNGYTAVENWLESLKPQNTWKPSDEQMEALESATENCAYSEYQDCLRELIGQLKKLREE